MILKIDDVISPAEYEWEWCEECFLIIAYALIQNKYIQVF